MLLLLLLFLDIIAVAVLSPLFRYCFYEYYLLQSHMRSLGACEPLSIASLFVNCLWEGKGGRDYLLRLVMGKPTSENPSPEDGPSFHHSAFWAACACCRKQRHHRHTKISMRAAVKGGGQHLNQGNSY